MSTLDYIRDKYDLNLDQRMPVEIPDVDRKDLAALFAELGFNVGAEIGTERAAYAETLCKANPNLTLYCVDPWKHYSGYRDHVSQRKLDSFYEITKEKMKPYDCRIIRKFSVEAAELFRGRTLDFVYIDANHDLQNVVNDLYAWWPKVKMGGIIAGHDFVRRKQSGYGCMVVEAVTAFTEAFHVRPWFVMGRKHAQPGEKRDSTRSWLWVRDGH
jgi:hypothetical protein